MQPHKRTQIAPEIAAIGSECFQRHGGFFCEPRLASSLLYIGPGLFYASVAAGRQALFCEVRGYS